MEEKDHEGVLNDALHKASRRVLQKLNASIDLDSNQSQESEDDNVEGENEEVAKGENQKENANDSREQLNQLNSEKRLIEETERIEHDLRLIEDHQTRGLTYRELAEKYGESLNRVFRVVNGQTRLDGKSTAGRNPLLSLSVEVSIANSLKELITQHRVPVKSWIITEFAQAAYRALHPSCTALPKFGKNWIKGFNKRHPALRLHAKKVKFLTKRRDEASTYWYAKQALNSMKLAFGKAHPACMVYVADELDISENAQGTGERDFAVGERDPRHSPPDDTPHVTACPFISLSGNVPFVAYVVQGTSEPAESDPDDKLEAGKIYRNSHGSVDTSIWQDIVQEFCVIVDDIYGCFSTRNKEVILIVDGYRVHLDPVASKILEAHGVKTLILPPNITHFLQVGDRGLINGKIQQHLRWEKAIEASLNNGVLPPIEKWIHVAEQIIRGVVHGGAVYTCAKEVGFEYDGDFKNICITQESIERTLKAFVASGQIRTSDTMNDDEYELRQTDYVRQFKVAKELGILHPRPISEKVLTSMLDLSDKLCEEYTGNAPVIRKRRKAAKPVKLNPQAIVKIPSDPVTNLKKSRVDRDSRLTQLQMCFDVDVSPFCAVVEDYLRGEKTLEEAKNVVTNELIKERLLRDKISMKL